MKTRLLAYALPALFVVACDGDGPITEPASPEPTVQHAIGSDPASGATIQTNLDDYFPGQVIHVTGTGWAANETVRLFMTEDPDTHDDITMDVAADASGAFAVDFYDVQEHDLGVTFTLTATGLSSGRQATAVFTDNRIITQVELLNPASSTFVSAPAQITVAPNTAVTVRVTGTTNTEGGGSLAADDWKSTRWQLRGPAPSNTEVATGCAEDINITTATVNAQHTFTISGAALAGTYTVEARAFRSDGCADGPSTVVSYPNGVVVANPPANQAPTANPGGPYTGNEGASIPLSGALSNDPDGTITAYAWSYSVTSADAGASCTITNGTTVAPTIACNDDGTFAVNLIVTDNKGATSTQATTTLTLSNLAPVVVIAPTSHEMDEGGTASYTATITDAGTNDAVASFAWTTTVGACTLQTGATATGATFSCNDNGTGTVKLEATDDDSGTGSNEAALKVNNVAPTATFTAPASVNEGSNIDLSLSSVVDPGTADVITYAFDCGSGYGAASATATASCPTTDNGTRAVKGKVIDDDGGSTEYTANVVVNNVAPEITLPLNVPSTPIPVTQAVTVTWNFTDPGSDTWTCQISWDTGALFESATYMAPKSCKATKLLPAGVYTVTVKVSDDDLGTDSETATTYIVVYDPNGGFVTGGGWIDSPADAYAADPSLSGKATFGFVSKYLKGATTPSGNTEFQFHAGSLDFKSSSYEWLVVSGTRAQYKGSGSVNGVSGYGFLLTAVDGGNTGDQFRIKIWDRATGNVVYDNQMGAAEDSAAATYLSGGSIVIHTKK